MNLQELNQEKDLSARELYNKYRLYTGCEHPHFPQHQWRSEVESKNTIHSYWGWVSKLINNAYEDMLS